MKPPEQLEESKCKFLSHLFLSYLMSGNYTFAKDEWILQSAI